MQLQALDILRIALFHRHSSCIESHILGHQSSGPRWSKYACNSVHRVMKTKLGPHQLRSVLLTYAQSCSRSFAPRIVQLSAAASYFQLERAQMKASRHTTGGKVWNAGYRGASVFARTGCMLKLNKRGVGGPNVSQKPICRAAGALSTPPPPPAPVTPRHNVAPPSLTTINSRQEGQGRGNA